MAAKLQPDNFEEFLQKPKTDRHFRLNISRNTLIAFIVSLLIHAIILFFVVPKLKQTPEVEPPPFQVVLRQPESQQQPESQPQPEAAPIPEPIPEPLPIKKPKVMTKPADKKSVDKKPKPSDFSVPDVMATPKPVPESMPNPAPEKLPKDDNAPTDMMAYVNQKRAAREAAETDAARINAEAVAKEKGPSEEEKRDAKIKSNFQSDTRLFDIVSLGERSATFTFNGWQNNYGKQREYFEVEVSPGQDIHRQVIRRVISRIREDFKSDFNWKSHRLGRTIVLSARPEDGSGLEDFLMIEFFGQNYKTAL